MIEFTLNGKKTVYNGPPTARLLTVLRDEYGLTGVKCGCMEGECGACSVIMDGLLINSCMAAMGRVAQTEIVTIEGYSETKRFDVLQRAFAETGAVQCGFCTPGMVLAAECILSEDPDPSEEEIRTGISGNLCRCTGYNAIVNAVGVAAKEGRGLWQDKNIRRR
ncbi:MAG: (2Fe-2S)-binding protein [Oscillospiraceae bacterium]|nr:(2Fe-2S)-binding protein [Oscillospiraceae bacterium]